MATILPPTPDSARTAASKATNNEQRPRQTRPAAPQRPATHAEPTEARVMAEARAIYPDTSPDAPTEQEIAAEAYAIYLGRGGQDGQDMDDWLEAERLLRKGRGGRPPSAR